MAKPKPKFDVISGDEFEGADSSKHQKNINFSLHTLVSFKPITLPQEQFVKSYVEKETPVILQIGSAGSGKSAMTLYCALSEVLDKSTVYDKIIIIRSAVQDRNIGFVPGDAETKAEVMESPYDPIFNQLLTFKSNNYRNLKAKNIVEFHTTSFLRGMTFDNSVIVADECQNMNYSELSTIMTRVGVNSRVVFCGDFKQTTLSGGDKSGLGKFINVLSHMEKDAVDVITYKPEDIVRSGIVKQFLIAEELSEEQ